MRDRVKMKLGAREQSLLPAFEVVDAFEDRFYGLLEHLEKLMQGRATIHARGFLILEGLKASSPDVQWDYEQVMKMMFDRGLWHEGLVKEEAEFIERMLYTPEQYQAKKEERAAEAEAMKDLVNQDLSSFLGEQSAT